MNAGFLAVCRREGEKNYSEDTISRHQKANYLILKEHGCNDKVIMPCVGQKYLLAGNIIKNISSMNGFFF